MKPRTARSALRVLAAVLCALVAFARATHEPSGDLRESTVGVPARIADLVLPGSELEVAPTDPKNPLVVRITAVHPHGSMFRYDFEWFGLDPGEFDLRSVFKRKDGTTILDLPRLPVTVRSVLGEGIVVPHAPAAREAPRLGGYGAWMIALGILWLAGLAALVFVGRDRRAARAAAAGSAPRTLAERLRPLVERAIAGDISARERSELELALVAHWRRRLGFEDRRPAESLALLREHAEAGPLLRGLEDWLHRPDPPQSVDVDHLLAPYRDLPAESFELESGRA